MNPERGVLSYPIPPYQNVPIHAEYYLPRFFFISGLTLGLTTIVTTTVDHDYVIGQEVRLIIPPYFGSRQLNEKKGFVISIPSSNQVELDINSQFVDPLIPSSALYQPQILAIGDVNTGAINNHGRCFTSTHIPGSFIDISPV
ncbi:MAG: hypothetical protein ABI554_02270 [Flavobacterium sp.]